MKVLRPGPPTSTPAPGLRMTAEQEHGTAKILGQATRRNPHHSGVPPFGSKDPSPTIRTRASAKDHIPRFPIHTVRMEPALHVPPHQILPQRKHLVPHVGKKKANGTVRNIKTSRRIHHRSNLASQLTLGQKDTRIPAQFAESTHAWSPEPLANPSETTPHPAPIVRIIQRNHVRNRTEGHQIEKIGQLLFTPSEPVVDLTQDLVRNSNSTESPAFRRQSPMRIGHEHPVRQASVRRMVVRNQNLQSDPKSVTNSRTTARTRIPRKKNLRTLERQTVDSRRTDSVAIRPPARHGPHHRNTQTTECPNIESRSTDPVRVKIPIYADTGSLAHTKHQPFRDLRDASNPIRFGTMTRIRTQHPTYIRRGTTPPSIEQPSHQRKQKPSRSLPKHCLTPRFVRFHPHRLRKNERSRSTSTHALKAVNGLSFHDAGVPRDPPTVP